MARGEGLEVRGGAVMLAIYPLALVTDTNNHTASASSLASLWRIDDGTCQGEDLRREGDKLSAVWIITGSREWIDRRYHLLQNRNQGRQAY